ncbi:MAG: DUF5995 family protein [Bacteroidota bacterium]
MQLPQNIDEVIAQLEQIIQDCIGRKSPLGYFAALYQKVTIAVKQGIANGRFENGERMERLDVLFANRYLEAYYRYQKGERITAAWQIAFEAAERQDLLILQQLFLGINAHINLDLGLATAATMQQQPVEAIRSDFEMINAVLFELMREVQTAIGMVSPLLFLVDVVSEKGDERLAAFSLKASRIHAWDVATKFHGMDSTAREAALLQLDQAVVRLARLIDTRGWLRRIIVRVVRRFESKNHVRVISNLHGAPRQK